MKWRKRQKLEEINKSLNENQEKTNKQVKQTIQTLKELKTETETIKKTQTKGIMVMEKSGQMNRNYRGKYNQQNTRDERENLWY